MNLREVEESGIHRCSEKQSTLVLLHGYHDAGGNDDLTSLLFSHSRVSRPLSFQVETHQRDGSASSKGAVAWHTAESA